jgi:hypothetical protein
MTWARKFANPIALKDGRTIETLAEARGLLLSLPEADQRKEHWLYAGGLMQEAATLDGPMKITAAQLTRALKAEGLIYALAAFICRSRRPCCDPTRWGYWGAGLCGRSSCY